MSLELQVSFTADEHDVLDSVRPCCWSHWVHDSDISHHIVTDAAIERQRSSTRVFCVLFD